LIRRILFELMYWIGRTPWDTGVTPPEVVNFVANHKPARAIDLGCGTGTNALYLAEHGWQVVGADFSRGAIRTARRKIRDSDLPIEFHQTDVTRLEGIQGPFDLALDIGCFHSLPVDRRQDYATRVGQLAAPNGYYLLYAWLPGDDPSSSNPSQEQVKSLFGPTFELLAIELGSEGSRHSAWYTFKKRA
jgi:cyclopropane fatty-acyl-phospholipid synthase-like methyltransferase